MNDQVIWKVMEKFKSTENDILYSLVSSFWNLILTFEIHLSHTEKLCVCVSFKRREPNILVFFSVLGMVGKSQ